MIKRGGLVWSIGCLLVFLSACGGGSDSGTELTRAFNQADVEYAVAMSAHHSQAVIMAEFADTQARSPKINALARRLREAQAKEVDRIAGRLNDWGSKGAPMPPHGSGGEGAHGPGMATAEEMDRLQRARGREFDRRFLSMMIRHHAGAIQLARAETAHGQSSEAKRSAEQIKTTQPTEIGTGEAVARPGVVRSASILSERHTGLKAASRNVGPPFVCARTSWY
jgi:uncharacterized protein (DUF305 family)